MKKGNPRNQSIDQSSSEFVLDEENLEGLGRRTGKLFQPQKSKPNFDGFARLSQYPSYRSIVKDSMQSSKNQNISIQKMSQDQRSSSIQQKKVLSNPSKLPDLFSLNISPIYARQYSTSRMRGQEIPTYRANSMQRKSNQDRHSVSTYKTLLNELQKCQQKKKHIEKEIDSMKNEAFFPASERQSQISQAIQDRKSSMEKKNQRTKSIEEGKRIRKSDELADAFILSKENQDNHQTTKFDLQMSVISQKVENQLKKTKKNKTQKKPKNLKKTQRISSKKSEKSQRKDQNLSKQKKKRKKKIVESKPLNAEKRKRTKPLQYWKNEKVLYQEDKAVIIGADYFLSFLQPRSTGIDVKVKYSGQIKEMQGVLTIRPSEVLQFEGYLFQKPIIISNKVTRVVYFQSELQKIQLRYPEQIQVNASIPFKIINKGARSVKISIFLPRN